MAILLNLIYNYLPKLLDQLSLINKPNKIYFTQMVITKCEQVKGKTDLSVYFYLHDCMCQGPHCNYVVTFIMTSLLLVW